MTRQQRQQSGFTIVELMIVIAVIGILATITVLAFTGLQRRANESASATAVEAASKKLEVYKVSNRFYPLTLGEADVVNYSNTSYQYTRDSTTKLDYCITATTSKVSMFGTDDVKPTKGGCPGHGVDGVLPVMNFARNPSFEGGSMLPDWSYTNTTGYTGSVSTAVTPQHGTRAAAVALSATAVAANAPLVATVTVPSAGAYTVSAYVRIASAAASFAGGSCLSSGRDVAIHNGTTWVYVCYNRGTLNTWQRVSANVTTTGTSLQLQFHPPFAVGTTMYVDALMVTNGTSAYADGSTPGWAWTGTANQSTSTGVPK